MKNSGIYITDNFIRFGQDGIEEEINLASLGKEAIPLAIKTFLKEKKILAEHLILGIPRTQVSIKYLTLPTLNDAEIEKMVEYEVNNLFPYKPEEMVIDHTIVRKGPQDSQLILVAVPREPLLKKIAGLKLAGLVPDAINISTVSLFNQFSARNMPPANYLLINLDDAFLEMVLISGQRMIFSRGISFNAPIEAGDLIKDIELTVTVLRDKGNSIDKIILSGKGLELKSFAQGLGETLPYAVEIDNTLNVLKGLVSKSNGNALKINLLPREFIIQKNRQKGKRAIVYFIALLLLDLSLLSNIAYLRIKAKQEYLYLLKSEIQKIEPQASVLQEKMLKLTLINDYIKSGRLTLGLLSEIYQVVPEGITFSSLDIYRQKAAGTMTVSGQAKDSERILKFADALKGSLLVKKADVNYISKRKPASQDETVDFEIKASF